MKIEELRLGNITKQGIVFMIGYDRGILGCWFIKNKYDSFADGFVKADDIEPIPLTPEILEKAGFEFADNKRGTQGIYSDGYVSLIISNSGNIYTKKHQIIMYVHDLQNWYYYQLLSGRELEIKL